MNPGYVSIIILVCTIVLYVTNKVPIAVTAMLSAAAMVVFRVIPAGRAWAAFSQDSVLIMAGVILIGSTLFSSGAASIVGDLLIKLAGGKPRLSIFMMFVAASIMSMFLSNTSCVVIFLPLILSVVIKARANDKTMMEHKFMQPFAAIVSVAGLGTLIGSPVNIAASGFVQAAGFPAFTFLQMLHISAILFVVTLLYVFTFGEWYGNKIFANREHSDFVKTFIVEREAMEKQVEEQKSDPAAIKKANKIKITITVIMFLTIAGLVTQGLHGVSLGTVAIIGGLLTVITGCITVNDMYKKIDWGTLMLLAGTIGCAVGLAESGGGRIIANFFIGLLGDAINPTSVFVVMCLVAAVITQFVSNTGTVAMLIPIGIAMTEQIGSNYLPVALGILMTATLSFMTPMASPTTALVLNWGSYKFNDYIKYSGPLNVVLVVLVIILTPLFFPLV